MDGFSLTGALDKHGLDAVVMLVIIAFFVDRAASLVIEHAGFRDGVSPSTQRAVRFVFALAFCVSSQFDVVWILHVTPHPGGGGMCVTSVLLSLGPTALAGWIVQRLGLSRTPQSNLLGSEP